MNKYNPNIHHRRSIRMKGYDYSQAGQYFITICVQDRACLFGKIENGKMILNEYGKIAHNEWMRTPEIRPNVEIGEFIIMPNHMHGIIHIMCQGVLNSCANRGELNSPLFAISHSPNIRGVCNTPLISPSQTIGAIVRGYKSAVTKQLGLLNLNQQIWQRNYYENIINNDQSYQNISNYIVNNPAKWNGDKFHTK